MINQDFDEAASVQFFLKNDIDLNTRTIFLSGEITKKSAKKILKQLFLLNNIDTNPITIIINSEGGSVDDAFSIIDAIKTSPSQIIGLATGQCASAALGILASCHKRIGSSYCLFLHHATSQAFNFQKLQTTKIELELSKKRDRQFDMLLGKMTKKPTSFWSSFKYEDLYFFSDDALEFGLIDEIE